MNLQLSLLIIFVVVVLYLIFTEYQKSAIEKAKISSRSQELNAISNIYASEIGFYTAQEENKTTAGDWIDAGGTVVDIIGMFYTGGASAAI